MKSIWIAIFLMAIPVGYAAGYIYGGIIGSLLGWRLAFLSEALLMSPFVALGFLSKPIPFAQKAPPSRTCPNVMRVRSGSPESVPEHESLLLPDPEAATSITSGHADAENGRARPQAALPDGERENGSTDTLMLPASKASVMADAGSLLKCALRHAPLTMP